MTTARNAGLRTEPRSSWFNQLKMKRLPRLKTWWLHSSPRSTHLRIIVVLFDTNSTLSTMVVMILVADAAMGITDVFSSEPIRIWLESFQPDSYRFPRCWITTFNVVIQHLGRSDVSLDVKSNYIYFVTVLRWTSIAPDCRNWDRSELPFWYWWTVWIMTQLMTWLNFPSSLLTTCPRVNQTTPRYTFTPVLGSFSTLSMLMEYPLHPISLEIWRHRFHGTSRSYSA